MQSLAPVKHWIKIKTPDGWILGHQEVDSEGRKTFYHNGKEIYMPAEYRKDKSMGCPPPNCPVGQYDVCNYVPTTPDQDSVRIPYCDENGGGSMTIDELVALLPEDQDTTLAGFSFSGTTITLTDSAGNSVSQDLAVGNLSVNPDDVITSLSVSGSTITIGTLSGGSFTDTINNTVNTGLTVVGGNIVLTDSDNNSVSLPVSDIDTDTTYTFTQSANGTVTAEAFDANGNSLGVQTFQGDADVTIVDTAAATGSPVTVTQTGTNAQGDPEYTVDYDASLTPDTSTAGAGPWRQVVEDPATGNEHVLQSGPGWRLYHDGTADMWGKGYEATGLDEAVVSLPFAISNPSDVAIVVTSYHNGPFMDGITSDVSAYEYGDVTATEFTAGSWRNNPRGYHLFSWHLKGAIAA